MQLLREAALCALLCPLEARASPAPGRAMPHVLFVDHTQIASLDPRLDTRMQPPVKGPPVLWPTESWESWAVFAYNSVVAGDKAASPPRPHRMYYDCIEGTGVPPGVIDDYDPADSGRQQDALTGSTGSISSRRICLAESDDGVTWSKPKLGIFPHNTSGKVSTANNILLEDSGNSVFFDPSDSEHPWKMVCSDAAYASKDGLHWDKLPFKAQETDDTKPTAYYDPALNKYVVSVRRDCTWDSKKWPCVDIDGHTFKPLATRYVGRCVTSNLSNWQQDYGLAPNGVDFNGCPVVFGPDEMDPDRVDVYTNAWTPCE